MNHRWSKWAIILISARLALGCATIIHGSSQDIQVASSPDNAEIWIDGARMGTTPTKLTLSRKHEHNITVKKEGFKDVSVSIENATSAWIVGNIVFGGIPGCAIDLITGGAYDLKPERVDINMTKIAALDGETIRVDQARLDQIKEMRFLDENGLPELVVMITWVD
jgi:hypothetical protein